MNIEKVREIANAVLYEGYLLYPYRRSAIKNRQRWTPGVVYPCAYSEANGGLEPWFMHTECLVTGSADLSFDVYARFLHLLRRSSARPVAVHLRASAAHEGASCQLAGQLAYEPWDEGLEREVSALDLSLHELLVQPRRVEISFSAGRLTEPSAGPQKAEIVLERQELVGTMLISAARVSAQDYPNLYKLSVRIENTTHVDTETRERRDAILLHSFISTHTLLHAHEGSFISLLETPDALQDAAKSCQNVKTWPVLVGDEGAENTMLSSPIILYDYPQIAPESPGAFFDGTEIDEMLALRVLTLSDEEKAELRQGDARARELLERTESLSPGQFMQLHGTMRDMHPLAREQMQNSAQPNQERGPEQGYPGADYPPPTSLALASGEARVGDRVRLHPKVRADAFDLLLADKIGRVEAIQQDFENRLYLVVTLDDDPGREQWDERVLPGHRFFFFPEEVELLEIRA